MDRVAENVLAIHEEIAADLHKPRDAAREAPALPTREEIEAIRARAAAATPGPWTVRDDEADYGAGFTPIRVVEPLGIECGSDAAHIAGMDPPTTLRLLAEVDRLTRELAEARAALARVQGWASTALSALQEAEMYRGDLDHEDMRYMLFRRLDDAARDLVNALP